MLGLGLAALGAAFNLGQQWNRQDRIAEIDAELKHRDMVLPADVMAKRYEFYERVIADIQKIQAERGVTDARINGHIENLTGKLDSVWSRQAQDQRDISELRANMARDASRLDMLIKEVEIHNQQDFVLQRNGAK